MAGVQSKNIVAIKALRPLHWIKSGFCLAALFLEGAVFDWASWQGLVPLLIAMSLLSSSGYLFNDICNKEEDLRHPRKRKRPVASGVLSVGVAARWAVGVLTFGMALLVWHYGFGWVTRLCLGYLVISTAYNLVLRGVPLVDVLVLSLGFVIRVAAGAFAIGIVPSVWLLLCTYTVSLLIGFGKRRGEFSLLQAGGGEIGETRNSLKGYTLMLLDALVGLSAVLAVGAYVMYVMKNDSLWRMVSIIPVIVGVSEYIRWAWRSDQVEVPEKLLGRSPVMLGAVMLWILSVVIAGL